eukprot:PLAT1719.1.p1 GENE.PLAT1719.1~~PLAT1719.1.p1  ORF type:complete len:1065 (-),score=522.65 PLAT1719.1:67-3237(-)
MSLVTVATCNLNQWALDFDGNLQRIKESIRQARAAGARYRLGPELEVPGYGCEDHFLERDTEAHSWESMASLIADGYTDDMIVDVGMPVSFRGVAYNCRVFVLNGRILLVRPKMNLANDLNYREIRYFTPWPRTRGVESLRLPGIIRDLTGQKEAPFGFAALRCLDGSIAAEICEEMWVADPPHAALGLAGVDIISNGSGSHHQLRKLDSRLRFICGASATVGGLYMYSNQVGCDGGRLYFDGCSLVALNGNVLVQASQFSVHEVEVVTAVADLEEVRAHRAGFTSHRLMAAAADAVPFIDVDFLLCERSGRTTMPVAPERFAIAEEIASGPACWLWDYLRRSGASGFFLPLSGGSDSSAVAALVSIMCHHVCKAMHRDPAVLRDVRRIVNDRSYSSDDPKQLASLLMHSSYMATENSGAATRARAKALAEQIGGFHVDAEIDTAVAGILSVFTATFGKTPSFKGGRSEDLALQNVQARVRMVLSYLFAQLLPWVRGRSGFLLVLGSANVDEGLRGYMTKYDCSSADINPIGGICKSDLRIFLRWAADAYDMPALLEVVEAPPSAELRPLEGDGSGEHSQTDEEDMGMTYDELAAYGSLRKISRAGPVTMFTKLLAKWSHLLPTEVASKVKRFFFYYAINRHKMTTITPSYHAVDYSPDDNRHDHRPFLYPVKFTRQFAVIDRLAVEASAARRTPVPAAAALDALQAAAAEEGVDEVFLLALASWCPDCVVASPLIDDALADKPAAVVVYVDVGDRTEWRAEDNPLRVEEQLLVNCVPTLLRWSGDGDGEEGKRDAAALPRLGEDGCASPLQLRRMLRTGARRLNVPLYALDETLERLGGGQLQLFVLVVASWCPDCVAAQPVLDGIFADEHDAVVVTVDVGARGDYRDPAFKLRTDKRFKLPAVPTLYKWGLTKPIGKLVEEDCADVAAASAFVQGGPRVHRSASAATAAIEMKLRADEKALRLLVTSSWCPDCRRAEPVIDDALSSMEEKMTVIVTDVGERAAYRDASHPLRAWDKLELKAIPTLYRWGEEALPRLVEGECFDVAAVRTLLAVE